MFYIHHTSSKPDQFIRLTLLSILNISEDFLNQNYIICEYGLFLIFFSSLTKLTPFIVSSALAKICRTTLKRNDGTKNPRLDPSFNQNTPMFLLEV